MAIIVEDKSLCCGCMACANACPKNAIHTITDDCGFLYPQVDSTLCIECGICDTICDFQIKQLAVHPPRKTYSLVHKDPNIVKKSTSGGAFTALSDWILSQEGMVVGAAIDANFTVYHHIAETVEQRNAMRGSLYVQSDIRDSFRVIRRELKNNRQVLFVGTPCQAAGLKSFLGKEYDTLYVVEFLCHGVPNNEFFKAHISWLELQYGRKAIEYSFRGKKYGWNPSGIEEVIFHKFRSTALKVQAYKHFFHSNVSLRPSCRNCSYRQWKRCADITIGDFWGVQKLSRNGIKQGVSFVSANTEKGIHLLELLNENATLTEYPTEVVRYRISEKAALSRLDTNKFWSLYKEKGYDALVRYYYSTSIKNRIVFSLKKLRRRLMSGWKG